MTRRPMDESFSTRQRAWCTAASLREQANDRGARLHGRSRRVVRLWSQVTSREDRQAGRICMLADYHREEKE